MSSHPNPPPNPPPNPHRARASVVGTFVLTLAALCGAVTTLPGVLGRPDPVVVESGSMTPAISPGDVVVLRDAPATIPDGAIVSFRGDDGRLVTHRIAGRTADGSYRTRGDANPTFDSEPVPAGDIIGIAAAVVPHIGSPTLWWRTGRWAPLAALTGVLVAAVAAVAAAPPTNSARSGSLGAPGSTGVAP